MGKGGINFRLPGRFVCALGVAFVAGCRSPSETEELRSVLLSGPTPALSSSLVVGHRFGRWLEVEPDLASVAVLEKACLLEKTGEIEQALDVLSEALEELPESAPLLLARGALYFSSGFPRAASGDFQRAVEIEPREAEAWYALGHSFEALELARQALEALDQATRLGLDSAELHLSRARTLRSLARRGLAAHEYQLALERTRAPTCELLVEAAILASEARESTAGIQALASALEPPDYRSENRDFVRILLQESLGVPTETVAGFLRALEVDPEELRHLTMRVLLALELAEPETRVGARERALASEADPVRRAALARTFDQVLR